ncbi:MAG: HD domain-containing protein [Clostridia bacterium]|nr:HD domain-containing protein [Clostridia bacterium]
MDFEILDRAILFAVNAHKGQLRKDGTAFILHPLEDASIVGTMTSDPEILAAAVLHDTVEDTPVTGDDILENFGSRVYGLVMHETENKRPEIPPSESWRVRKEESLASLAASDDPAVLMLWLGDKLSNIRALHRQFMQDGLSAFEKFNNGDPADHKWYYMAILELLEPLAGYPAYKEYSVMCHDIFDGI